MSLFPGYEVTASEFDIHAWMLYPPKKYLPLKTRVFVDFVKASTLCAGDGVGFGT